MVFTACSRIFGGCLIGGGGWEAGSAAGAAAPGRGLEGMVLEPAFARCKNPPDTAPTVALKGSVAGFTGYRHCRRPLDPGSEVRDPRSGRGFKIGGWEWGGAEARRWRSGAEASAVALM